MSTDKTELRGQCPKAVADALDALALAIGLDRNAYVNQVLEKHVRKELHRVSLLARTVRGNPLMPDSDWSPLE